MPKSDFKTVIKSIICLLDRYYCNSSNQTKAEQALKVEFTNSIQSIIEYANKRFLRNFQYELRMIDYEDDEH